MQGKTMRLGGIGTIGAAKPAAGKKAASGSFALSEDVARPSAGNVNSGMRVSLIAGPLFIEDESTLKEQRRRAIERGEDVLEVLEKMHGAMLRQVDDKALSESLKTILSIRAETADEELAGTLNQIEVRARVELAKRGIY